MVRLLRWIGFLVTVFRNALVGAAGASAGGGGGGGASCTNTGFATDPPSPTANSTAQQTGYDFTVGESDLEVCKVRHYHKSGVATSTLTIFIWDRATQTLVTSTTLTSVEGEWVEADLPTPVTLSAGGEYAIVAYKDGLTWNFTIENDFTWRSSATGFTVGNYRRGTGPDYPTQAGVGEIRGILDLVYS